MSRDEIFSYVLSGYASPIDGAVVRETTARRRFNKVKAFIDSNVALGCERSPASLFADQEALRVFLSGTPVSNRPQICACFEEILSFLSLTLRVSSAFYESIRHSVPTLLRRCKTKANSSYRIQREEKANHERSLIIDSSIRPDFKELQARAVAQLVPRLRDILILASSYLHEVRAEETLAARYLAELEGNGPRHKRLEEDANNDLFLTISEEDEFIFGPGLAGRREQIPLEGDVKDEAGRFLRLKRFPESLCAEATGILLLLINLSVKPERPSSLREMTQDQASELEQSLTCELRVKKRTASHKMSQCVITPEIAPFLRDYRLSLKVLCSNKLKRSTAVRPFPLGEKYKKDIERFYKEALGESILVKLQGPQRLRTWRDVQKSLLASKGVSLTISQIQTVFHVSQYSNL